MLMMNFDLGWPIEALWFFAVAGYASDANNFISIDCLLGDDAVFFKIVAI
jgi:hypothetical protein